MRPLTPIIAAASAALLNLLPAHAQVTWQTRMIQSQISGATGLPELVDKKGSRPSIPIGDNGSRFEIWGWKLEAGTLVEEIFLDSTEVGTYQPHAEIRITSLDPYPAFHRSRVDQPFTVTYQVNGLMPAGAGSPVSSTKVLVEHHIDLYAPGSYDGSQVEATSLLRSFEISTNGDTPFTFPVTNIVARDLARRSGRERFIVHALADGTTPQRVIAQTSIEICPIPEGNFNDLDLTKSYRSLPEFTVSVWRAYPSSSSWVEVYEGGYVSNKRGTILGSTYEAPDQVYPVSYSMLDFETFPSDLQPTTSAGMTFVLRSSSPFPGESLEEGGLELSNATIRTDPVLRINTMLSTIE